MNQFQPVPNEPQYPVSSFEVAKAQAIADPLTNKTKRVENLLKLEETATKLSESGGHPDEVSKVIDTGRLAIANTYPDVPEYQKAATVAGRFRQMRQDPAEVISQLPI